MSQSIIKKISYEKIKIFISNHFFKNWVVCIFTMILVAFILFCRKPDAFLNPQFWAEDGVIFFKQNIDYGLKSFIVPYAGYLHTAPKIIALITSWFPVSMTPLIYNGFALVITMLTAGMLFSSRCFIPYKVLVGLSIVLVPHSGEVFMNITSVQWFLCLWPMILLCIDPPEKFYQYILDYLVIIICGLTGPFILFLFPLFFVRFIVKRTHHNYGLALVVFICSIIQGMIVYHTFERGDKDFSSDINGWVNLFGIKLFARLFLIEKIYKSINPYILAFCSLLMPIFLIWLTSTKKQLYFTFSYLFFGYAIVFSAIYKSRELSVPFVYDMNVGDRFFFPFYIMIMWILAVSLTSPISFKRQIATVLIILVFISTSQHFSSFKYVDMHWEDYVTKIESGDYVRVPINPPGWFIELGTPEKNILDPNQSNI